MSATWIVITSVAVTLLILAFAPSVLAWLIYGLMMISRIIAGLVSALLGKRR